MHNDRYLVINRGDLSLEHSRLKSIQKKEKSRVI